MKLLILHNMACTCMASGSCGVSFADYHFFVHMTPAVRLQTDITHNTVSSALNVGCCDPCIASPYLPSSRKAITVLFAGVLGARHSCDERRLFTELHRLWVTWIHEAYFLFLVCVEHI